MSPADDIGGQWEFVNRSRHVVIAPLTTIDAAVREAQASVIQEGISAAIPAHTAPLGRRLDDQAMVMAGRINATDWAILAVPEPANATDRQLAVLETGLAEERHLRTEGNRRYTQELEEEKKRVNDATSSVNFTKNEILMAMWADIKEPRADHKEQREESGDINSRLSAENHDLLTSPMLSYPVAHVRSVFSDPPWGGRVLLA